MSSARPYLREVEVLVGPVEEWRGGGDDQLSVRFFGDGTTRHLRVKFGVKKHIITTSNPTTVEVYNLTKELRAGLRRPGTQVIIRAGWANTEERLVQVFKGSLMTATHVRQGADLVTTLYCLAGFGGWSRAVAAETFGPGTSLRDVVVGLATKIPGVVVDPKNVDVRDVRLGLSGWSFGGLAADGLSSLARTYGFSWSIDDGVFRVLDDTRAWPGIVRVDPSRGLKRAEPMLVAPFQVRNGVSIHSVLLPQVVPGQLVDLETAVNPYLNGQHKITAVDHNGDTHTGEWDTHLECFLTGPELDAALAEQQRAIGGL